MPRIVIIAETQTGQEIDAALGSDGHEVARMQSVAQAAAMYGRETGGAELLFVESWLQNTGQLPADVPVVLIAPADALQGAVESVAQGRAYDLLRLPCSADEIRIVAGRALRYQQLIDENRSLRQQVAPAGQDESPATGVVEAARNLAGKPLADIEKQVILSTLEQFKGHRLRTAHALGIGVRTLGMKIKRWREEGEPIAGRQHRPPVHVDVS